LWAEPAETKEELLKGHESVEGNAVYGSRKTHSQKIEEGGGKTLGRRAGNSLSRTLGLRITSKRSTTAVTLAAKAGGERIVFEKMGKSSERESFENQESRTLGGGNKVRRQKSHKQGNNFWQREPRNLLLWKERRPKKQVLQSELIKRPGDFETLPGETRRKREPLDSRTCGR